MMLFAIKFKLRKLLITCILVLCLAFGTKVGVLVPLVEKGNIDGLVVGQLTFLILNCAIPWCLLLLWNKLKESKWK